MIARIPQFSGYLSTFHGWVPYYNAEPQDEWVPFLFLAKTNGTDSFPG